MMVAVLRGVIRNGRVETEGPINLPDGTTVVVAPDVDRAKEPVSPAQIAGVLAAMQRLQPLDIPDEVAADLDAWERQLSSGASIWGLTGCSCCGSGARDDGATGPMQPR